ncbi:MAG: FAD-dependent oxidoreductase, partial [Clostridia bacterium]|nr:FAD-dependent oxidoreductase [Clostridia bacterium]
MKRLISLMIVLALTLAGFSALADGAADGTYTASGEGKDGPVVVETTFEGGKITSVVVTEQNETPEIARLPLEQIPAAIVKAGAWDVDSVTGATITSDAIKAAVKDAIVQAGGNPADYEKGAAAETEAAVVNLEADVVVVGAGAAGVTAALAAQQNGANTILLEKAASVGGVSIIAGGPMGIDSKDQQAAGVAGTFTIQQVWRDWMDYNCWLCDGTLFYNLFKDSGATVDWLEENGMEFNFMGNEQAAHADGYPTYHIYADQENKYGYYETLVNRFTEAGGELYVQTAGFELEAENDAITGIKARRADGTVLDIACKAVCLCTGGFAANEEAVTNEVGFHLEEVSTGTQTGDGAAMSQAIGAGK